MASNSRYKILDYYIAGPLLSCIDRSTCNLFSRFLLVSSLSKHISNKLQSRLVPTMASDEQKCKDLIDLLKNFGAGAFPVTGRSTTLHNGGYVRLDARTTDDTEKTANIGSNPTLRNVLKAGASQGFNSAITHEGIEYKFQIGALPFVYLKSMANSLFSASHEQSMVKLFRFLVNQQGQ